MDCLGLFRKNGRFVLILVLLMPFAVNGVAQTSTAPSGSGTEGDPYLIANLENLYWLTQNSSDWDGHYKQTTNISAATSSNWDSGSGFTPIGNNTTEFTGSYNGSGYTISDIYISRESTDYIGLFGKTDNAAIDSLGITNANVTGKQYVGGLIGYNDETDVSESYVTGTVTGTSTSVGGLIGFNISSDITNTYTSVNVTGSSNTGGLIGLISFSTIIQSYSTASVNGSTHVGGLTGSSGSSTFSNCYSTSDVNGLGFLGGLVGSITGSTSISNCYSNGQVASGAFVGGLIGNSGGTPTINNSYWDTEASGQSSSSGGEGLTTSEMMQETEFSGWDFENTWAIDEGLSYPYLTGNAQSPHPDYFPFWGSGKEYDPFLISSIGDLEQLSINTSYWGYNFKQTADIDASATSSWNSGAGFTPIGTLSNKFTASYDGEGHSITGLFINSTTERYVGMFGYTNGAEITDLTLTDADITGDEIVGGLIAQGDNSTISGISITGSVTIDESTSFEWLGGIIGYNISSSISLCSVDLEINSVGARTGGIAGLNAGTISNSFVQGNISTTGDFVGGIAGNNNGNISNSYSIADVTGTDSYTGGLAGTNYSNSTISNSYAAGFVDNGGNSGSGLVGQNDGTVTDSYWNASTSDQGSSDGGTGRDSGQMKDSDFFDGWDFSTVWDIDEGLSFPYLRNNEQNPHPTDLEFEGSGTENDPYLIATFYDLFILGRNPALFDSFFEQTTDIDASQSWGTRELKPISISDFTGQYDGNNHTITGLTASYGMFSSTTGATIKNIGLIDVDINTNGANIGGLIGRSTNSTSVSDTYVTGSVAGILNVGGLIGQHNSSTISNSYSSASVSGSSNVGGLIGSSNSGSVTNSYWDTETSGQVGSAGGTGLTSAQMQQRSSFSGWDFATTWAIEEGETYPFLQDDGNTDLVISGDEGWRILASPVSGASFATILDTLWTQGITGADATNGSPNVYYWDEATQSFTAPDNMNEIPGSGVGFLTYVFADHDYDGTADDFPKVISFPGSQFSSQKTIALSYTDDGDENSDDDGWNLVGNPYGSTVHWDAEHGWGKTNIDHVIYVWSDSANSGAGDYLSWNGSTGTFGGTEIAPWQGFWVKANAASPSLTFTDEARSTGGVLRKKAPVQELRFTLTDGELSSKAIVVFNQQASKEKDIFDAYKLESLNQEYLSLFTELEDGRGLDINSLPFEFEEGLEIPMNINGSNLNGTFNLSWDIDSFPEKWNVILIDNHTGEEINLRETQQYSFEIETKSKVNQNESAESIQTLSQPNHSVLTPSVLKAKQNSSRFKLILNPNTSVSNESDSELPTSVELQQNYPNPFNPSTTIAYGVPESGKVTLEVFDMLGRKVATLLNGENKTAGRYTVTFNASSLASGMYIYRLQAGNVIMTKKLTLIK